MLPITDRTKDYADSVCEKLRASGLRVEMDGRNEKIGYKIREAKLEKVPYVIVVGDAEERDGTVNVNKRGVEEKTTMGADEFVEMVAKQDRDKVIF